MSRASRASLLSVLFLHSAAVPVLLQAQSVSVGARASSGLGAPAGVSFGAPVLPSFSPSLSGAFGLMGTFPLGALPSLPPGEFPTMPGVLSALAVQDLQMPLVSFLVPAALPQAASPAGPMASLDKMAALDRSDPSSTGAIAFDGGARRRGALPDAGPVPLGESPSPALLARAPAALPQAEEPAPAPAPPSRFTPRKLLPAAVAVVGLLALDWGAKALFVSMGWPFVYHELGPLRLLIMQAAIPINMIAATYYLGLAYSDEAPLKGMKRFREKHPVLGAALYGLLYVLTFPLGLGDKRYAGDLPDRHPTARTAQRILTFATAAILAATLGNGLEAIHFGRVVDFIPFGHGRMNLADVFIFFGLPFAWMGLDFFGAARRSEETGRPLALKTWRYYVLPVLGTIAFYQLTAFGYALMPVAGWYILVFSTLFLMGVLTADVIFQRLVERFNQPFTRPGDKK